MVQDTADKTSHTLCTHANVWSESLPMTHLRVNRLAICLFSTSTIKQRAKSFIQFRMFIDIKSLSK